MGHLEDIIQSRNKGGLVKTVLSLGNHIPSAEVNSSLLSPRDLPARCGVRYRLPPAGIISGFPFPSEARTKSHCQAATINNDSKRRAGT